MSKYGGYITFTILHELCRRKKEGFFVKGYWRRSLSVNKHNYVS